MDTKRESPPAPPSLEPALALVHALSLLEEAPTRWTTLVALRAALAPFVMVRYLEVVYRDPRRGGFDRFAVHAGRTDVIRERIGTGTARLAAERCASGPRHLAEVDDAFPGELVGARGVVAPLGRQGDLRGYLAVTVESEDDPSPAQLALIGDIALLIGAALATDLYTDALAAQNEIAKLLVRGDGALESWKEIAETFRRILHFDRLTLEGRADAEPEPWSSDTGVEAREGDGPYASFLRVPVELQGDRFGTLVLSTRLPLAYEESDEARAAGVAGLIAAHLALRQTLGKLAASEAEYRALYHQISATHKQLLQAEKLASVGQLAAGVAHEINNPAAVVMSNLSHLTITLPETRRLVSKYRAALRAAEPALASRLANEEAAAGLKDVEAEIDETIAESLGAMRRIRDIVRSLGRFARGPSPTPEVVGVRDLVERAITVAQNEIRHRARLVRDFRASGSVEGDPSSLEQVLVNVLLNAAQAIPEGGAEAHEVRVSITSDETLVTLEIADDGGGIPPEVLPRIFDPFFSTKPVGQGTGLGLSIAHDVVTKHGGEIHVTSTVGQGTTVRIELPLARRRASAPVPAPPKPRRRRIMIVDDEVPVLRAAERILRAEFDMFCCESGEAALRSLEGGTEPDVILCDLMMPMMTGMELYEQIARRFPTLEPRLLFMTGGAFTPKARAFAESMRSRIVEKPLEGPELREALLRHLAEVEQ